MFGEGKHLVRGGKFLEKENNWRRKTFGPQRRSRMDKEKEVIIWRRKIDGYLD